MHIIKKATPALLLFLFSQSLLAANTDTSLASLADTGKLRASRITNKNFNEIYMQQLVPSSAGQEYFDPHKTLLAADVTANFVLLNTPKLPFFFVTYTRVNLRLFAASGSPVRSPSYMPGGTVYFRLNRDTNNANFLSVSYTHHSNGIEGPTARPNGTINTDSGKFTTNFYRLTYYIGKRTDINDLIINRYDALALELHSALVGLGYAHALKNKYGFLRINGNWLYCIDRANSDAIDHKKKVFSNWQRIDFQFSYIADKYNDYNAVDFRKRLNVLLKYYYSFPFMRDASLMLGAGYRGQDEYNIFFQDSYAYVTIGVAAGLNFNTHRN
ncbi:MAG: hypothetical protein JWP44_53 [Mucilaginibacter sp.]|nr:hypothetical protein [Mucilaginibacter sp.]